MKVKLDGINWYETRNDFLYEGYIGCFDMLCNGLECYHCVFIENLFIKTEKLEIKEA